MKSFLQNYNVEICSTHNEGKSIVAERFIRNLKNKLYNYMASISKNVYTDKLYNILNKYNNTYYKTIKMKPLDVNKSFYIDFNKENTHLYSLSINRKALMFSIINDLSNGLLFLIQIITNLLKKYYFLGRRKLKIIQT